MSFKVNQGEFVALVGKSGGGKSTCMELLQQFYEIGGGDVLLDGESVKTMSHNELHSKITMVSQDPILFSSSIADNIRYP